MYSTLHILYTLHAGLCVHTVHCSCAHCLHFFHTDAVCVFVLHDFSPVCIFKCAIELRGKFVLGVLHCMRIPSFECPRPGSHTLLG